MKGIMRINILLFVVSVWLILRPAFKTHRLACFIGIIGVLLLPEIGHSKNPYIQNISKQTYGAANKNWNIKEDEKGFIYVANENGLLEFDGVKWTTYYLPNRQPIKSVYVENHNTIYTGNVEGFGKWSRDKAGGLIYEDISQDIPADEIIHCDFWQTWKLDNSVYFQSFKSIYRYKDKRVERLQTNLAILFLLPAGNQLFLQAMKGELYKVNELTLEKLEGTEALRNTDVRVILPYTKGKYIIGTSNSGLFFYDGVSLEKWSSPISEAMQKEELNCGIIKKDGNLLLGTILGGVFEANMDGEILNHFSTSKQLRNNTILSLCESKFGSVWIGYDSGLGNMQYWKNMDYFSFEQNTIGAVYAAKLWEDKLFLCTNQGVYYIDYNHFLKTKSLNSIKLIDKTQGQAWKLSVIDGHLFCSHNRGILEITRQLQAVKLSTDKNGVFSLAKQSLFGNEVLVASTYYKAAIIQGNTTRYIGINSIPVKYTLTDHLNNLWLKTPYKGVYKFRLDNNLNAIDTLYFGGDSNLNYSKDINMLQIGNRIVLSSDSLFYTYDEINNRIEPNGALNQCLKSIKDIKNIVSQKQYHYWIITSTSVHQIYYDGYEARILDQFSTKDFGLSLVERFENISILNDSLSLICLDNGFLLHTTMLQSEDYVPTTPSVLNVSGYTKNREVENYSIYQQQDSIIVFESAYSDLIEVKVYNPNSFYRKESFQYRLEPIDSDWSVPYHSNTINFQRLPSGKYTLYVRAANGFDDSSEVVKIDITIKKPFHQTGIAFLLYFLLTVLLLLAIWKLVLRHFRNVHLQKIRSRERSRLRIQNKALEKKIGEANAELFTRSNLILQKNKLFDQIREIIQSQLNGKDRKDIPNLYKRLTDLLSSVEDNEDQWEMILITFEQKHPDFFHKLKSLSSEITPNDLRICMCLRLNYDSKEIAQMLNLSVRTIDNNRSRLRTKLNVPSTTHLTDFLLEL